MTFAQALYTGKKFLRCPYNQIRTRTGHCVFNVMTDSIFELTGMFDSEFNSSEWEASDDEYVWEA
jgi:hypothetical protein